MSARSWRIELGVSEQISQIQDVEVRANDLFREIGLDSIADDDPPTTVVLQSHIDTQTLWIARLNDMDGAVAGYGTASVVDGEGHIDQVSVDPVASGLGIGSALLETGCKWAHNQGLHSVTLTTFVDVAWNRPFYLNHGFVEIGQDELGPQLAQIRADEVAGGVDVAARTAMRRLL